MTPPSVSARSASNACDGVIAVSRSIARLRRPLGEFHVTCPFRPPGPVDYRQAHDWRTAPELVPGPPGPVAVAMVGRLSMDAAPASPDRRDGPRDRDRERSATPDGE